MAILAHIYEYNESGLIRRIIQMLKYVIAWLLGVPLVVLVLIYLISHAF